MKEKKTINKTKPKALKKDSKKRVTKKPKKEIKKGKKSTYLFVIIAAILIFLLSIIYQIRKTSPPDNNIIIENEKIKYNEYTFEKKEDGKWYTEVIVNYVVEKSAFDIPFYYNPYEVEDIEFRRGLENLFIDKPRIYITVNPDYNATSVIAGTEISKILGKVWFKEVKAGLTKPPEGISDFPIITCNNITQKARVIELRLGEETKIFQESGCIIVQGTDEQELIRAADRLAFRILKIMVD